MRQPDVTQFSWSRETVRTPAEWLPHPIAQANPLEHMAWGLCNQRITEWLGLEGTLKEHLVPSPLPCTIRC